jgi:hypothetical protein
VFDGQSRVAIPTWDGAFGLGYSWARVLMASLDVVYPGYVVAVAGQSITDLTADFWTRAAPRVAGPVSEPTISVLGDIGASDILDEGDDAATVYSQAGAYAALHRAAGAGYVIACTTLPSVLFNTATLEARRLAANALYLADASHYFDAVADLCVNGLLDTSNRDVYLDGTHLSGPYDAVLSGFPGAGLGTPRAAAVVRPYVDAAIAAVT